jgi:holliday junction DNA helicase RuvA
MITFLDGELVEKDPTRIVLDVNGVGYEVSIPLSTYDRLPEAGARCRILTYDCVREDAHTLFGFATNDERRMFLLLIDVSGIGPKTAVTALSGVPVRDLKAAIVNADVKRLSSISGIGRKTAERIVVELRDKLGAGEAIEAVAPADVPADGRLRDALLALVSLGYKQADARKMVEGVVSQLKPEMTVEDVVRKALVR